MSSDLLKYEPQDYGDDPTQIRHTDTYSDEYADCPVGVLEPILARIHLADLGSPRFYRGVAADLGWRDEGFEDHTAQLTTHYSRVLEFTESRANELMDIISADYLERMKAGLRHWIEGGKIGHLCWGVFAFSKA